LEALLILLLPPAVETAEAAARENLFERLIRNPHPDSPLVKERECTEMLACVLIHAPRVRALIFEKWAETVGLSPSELTGLEFVIRTEQQIDGKRDDLRIEGFRRSVDRSEPVLLWTIEVKVQAGFHESSLIGCEEVESVDLEYGNQITNYDAWLNKQPHRHRAGFVLSLSSLKDCLPSCKCQWAATTWTSLGSLLEVVAGQRDQLPPTELFLARHLLGFIKKFLWRRGEMSDDRMDFDDVALLRAFADERGKLCQQRVEVIVKSLVPMIAGSDVGVGDVATGGKLFGAYNTYYAWRPFAPKGAEGKDPVLIVGVEGDSLVVWIQTRPGHPKKNKVRDLVVTHLEDLRSRNSEWKVPEQSEWCDLLIEEPLVRLLAAKSQLDHARNFVQGSLGNLSKTGLAAAITQVLKN
jgi:hypothetical protein